MGLRARSLRCVDPVSLPPPGHPAAIELGSLRLFAGVRGTFRPGSPYKVGIKRIVPPGFHDLRTITVRGWRCVDGVALRFDYSGRPLPHRKLTEAELRALGDLVARLEPYTPPGNQRDLIYTGYMLFWARGNWRLEAHDGSRLVGSVVLRLT